MRHIQRVAMLALALLAAAAGAARAHPHVFIDSSNDVLFDDGGRIAALRISWTFDQFYSVWAIEGLDTDGDGKYSRDELAGLARENVTNLEEYDYFTKIRVNDAPATYGEVTEYYSELTDNQLSLHMTLPLATPVDPRIERVAFSSYDPTFYIAMILAETNPVTFDGAAPPGCGFTIREPEQNAQGAYVPDDQIGTGTYVDIGARYAQTVSIVCTES